MYALILAIILIASLLMIGIVLIQESKGGGLASGFSTSNQIMGVRKTTDFLEKGTWTLAIIMVVFSVISHAFVNKTDNEVAPVESTTQTVPGMPSANPTEAAPNADAEPAAAPEAPVQETAPASEKTAE